MKFELQKFQHDIFQSAIYRFKAGISGCRMCLYLEKYFLYTWDSKSIENCENFRNGLSDIKLRLFLVLWVKSKTFTWKFYLTKKSRSNLAIYVYLSYNEQFFSIFGCSIWWKFRFVSGPKAGRTKLDKERLNLCLSETKKIKDEAEALLKDLKDNSRINSNVNKTFGFRDRIKKLMHEPQESTPDVFIW